MFALRIALLTLILCVPARAQELRGHDLSGQPVEITTSLVCDTQQQVERFVAVYDGNPAAAIDAVNAEVNDPNACIAAKIAYLPGNKLATARSKNATFEVVRVLILGIETDSGMQPIKPHVFFSVVQIEERDA